MSEVLVFLGAGRWQECGIHKARELGIASLALDASAEAPGLASADFSAVVDIRDQAAVIETIGKLGLIPIGALAIANESGMLCAAAVREHFGLPGTSVELTKSLCTKSLQRVSWRKAGLENPKFHICSEIRSAESIVQSIGLPAIAKPICGAGSRGIKVFRQEKEAKSLEAQEGYIVEEYISGQEYTVETFSTGSEILVLAVTQKRKVPGTNNTVADQLRTISLNTKAAEKIALCAARAMIALSVDQQEMHLGPGHCEIIRRGDGQLFLVETAGRGGGFGVFESLVPRSSGFDIVGATVGQGVGKSPQLPKERQEIGKFQGKSISIMPSACSGVLRFLPSRRGLFRSLHCEDDCLPSGQMQWECLAAVGQRFSEASCDGDRVALLLSFADSEAAALQGANLLESKLQVDILESARCLPEGEIDSGRRTSDSQRNSWEDACA